MHGKETLVANERKFTRCRLAARTCAVTVAPKSMNPDSVAGAPHSDDRSIVEMVPLDV
jgi:hypothetical protein